MASQEQSNMESFLEILDKIEQEYTSNRKYLNDLKYGAILLGIIMVLYGGLEILKFQHKYKFTDFQVKIMILFLAIIVMTPILTAPLYKLISSKRIREIKWTIKSSIFDFGLRKYTEDYRFSFNNTLPEKDLKNLKLIDNQFSFFRGNDMIIGHIKGHKFGISDIHAFSLRKRKFDGLVGVIHFKEFDMAESFYNRISMRLPKGGQLRLIEKKIYLLVQGEREHFEIEFYKQGINKEKLLSDFKFFESFVDVFLREI